MPTQFNLSSQLFSEAFWRAIFSESDFFDSIKLDFSKNSLDLETLRKNADYNTGSISAFSSWTLFLICRYFQVRRAFEVGTFIGRSTISISKAMNLIGGGEIHTCDASNDINIPQYRPTTTIQYKKQTSTQMLTQLSGSFDFAFIDGRLTMEDIDVMANLLEDNAIIVLDDFEGVEKGVANLFNLRTHPRYQNFFLVPPPSMQFAEKLGFTSRCLTAVLIDPNLISLTNQG